MLDEPVDEALLLQRFREHAHKCETLAEKLSSELHSLLETERIAFSSLEHRVKSEASFREKIQRKQYADPLNDIVDICGLRIICFYASDLEKVSRAIEREFKIHERLDKQQSLDPDRFGYTSIHFIVSPPDQWDTPALRPLRDLKVEIQVRTILMHAWAAVEHKLAYKKREHVPASLQRKLFQLSALFEIADQQFDAIRAEREQYMLPTKGSPVASTSVADKFPDVDALQQFLDAALPDRAARPEETVQLFDELQEYGLTSTSLRAAFVQFAGVLDEIEEDIDQPSRRLRSKYSRWGQAGVVRAVLDLTHEPYWKVRRQHLPRWRVDNTEQLRQRLVASTKTTVGRL